MDIPHWLKGYLTVVDLERIEGALTQAEKKTAGEIVPMVVRQSSAVGHVPMMLLLIGFIVILILELINFAILRHAVPLWATALIPVMLFLFVRLLYHRPSVQRFLTLSEDRHQQVEERAVLEFLKNGLNRTQDSTGVLIYISMMERRAVVLGDRGIAEKLKPAVWNGIIDKLTHHMGRKELAEAICQAIEQVGDILSAHFPLQGTPRNELKNQLLIRD
jgi:putative membrane protein